MADSHAQHIEQAGVFLLALLRERGSVKFSDIYEGRTEERFRAVMAFDADDFPSDFHLVDLAAAQLSKQGIIEMKMLPTHTTDDVNDYMITLTNSGRAKLDGGYVPMYRYAE